MTTPVPSRYDIAVIGMACRLPGADGPDAFWALLRAGVDAVDVRPAGRIGGRPAGRGGYLRPPGDMPTEHDASAVYGFEPEFFGMSPREARRTDPQQRLTLELAWEALEDAGIVPASLRGTRAGVFLAAGNGEWPAVLRDAGTDADVHAYTGSRQGMAAGRLSHVLGLTGPSLSVDTGQSSSLVAVHLAAESLRAGHAGVVLAGGVSLLLDDDADRAVAGTGALSPTGRSAVFDAAADGFVRGEGGGLVVLKPLAAALAVGDRVYCVLRGSALNHDGGDGALTVPDAGAQRDVLTQAHRAAGLEPGAVGYVELHGTGTVAGDPVEAAALGAVVGPATGRAPLPVGSVKTNIGHLEGAAGIAGLLKAALAVHHGELPASLHFTAAHPAIALEELNLRVPTVLEPWPGPRVAGVSSFGMGGANCHVVIGQAPAHEPPLSPVPTRAPSRDVVWPVSARTPAALRAQLAALLAHVGTSGPGSAADPADVAHTLAIGRTHFPVRCAVVGATREQMLHALESLSTMADPSGAVRTADGADPETVAAAEQFVNGLDVDWAAANGRGRRTGLPTYRFQRRLLRPEEAAGAANAAGTRDGSQRAQPREAACEPGVPDSAIARPADQQADSPGGDLGFGRLLSLVRRETAGVLELDSAESVPADETFSALGADSMTVVELTDRLQDALSRPLPTSLTFDHPTPNQVARYLAGPPDEVAAPEARTVPDPAPHTRTEQEPIALVGIGCRYPGGIRSAEDLWAAVIGERDVVGGLPTDRGWDTAGLGPARRQGGFLTDAADFDAGFFGISPREAQAMDPQQRLLLEVGWEAIEHAGLDPLSLRATQTGVFVGVIAQQYDTLVQRSAETLDGYVYTGSTPSVLAGRLAYVLGLEGPALAVDTACSASLTALHLACRSLRSGEVSMALAGGVTVMSTPWMFTDFTAQGALSPDGRSKAFADAADGTGWSEGVGIVVLERLSDARRNGHRVLAVVRGSALNEDGASNGLTAPSGTAQARVVHAALADAGLPLSHVDAVEAHGPGTRLGDPIEANALLGTYGAAREANLPLWLGSVKSNIGHTQAAAGVAGVIKMVMAMRHRTLPRTLHVDRPTSRVDWSGGGVRVLTRTRPWPSTGRPPRAAVSAFGAGGTNAHLVLEGPDPDLGDHLEPDASSAPATDEHGPLRAFPLAAKSRAALADQAGRLRAHLLTRPEIPLADVAWTLSRRTPFAHRAVALGRDRAEILDVLAEIAQGRGAGQGPQARAAVFVFPGQGSQWPGMAEGLLGHDAVFTESAERCATAFARFLDWSVLDVLAARPDAPPLDRVDVAQPVLFTMMVSLAEMWRARGVRPAAVVGHSQGEIAAAYVAGALTLNDAARIIALRSRALLGLQGRGAMAAVALDISALRQRLEPWGDALEVAAVNGPRSTTVGGDPEALDGLLSALDADEVSFRRLPGVGNAGHSKQIEPLRDHLLEALAPVSGRSSHVPFYSTVTGGRFAAEDLDSGYWWRNARQPVLLEPALRALLADGHRTFLEVNPHPLLHTALVETFEDAHAAASALSTLRRDEPPGERFLRATADAFRAGLPVDWPAVNGGGRLVPLPGYAFQRRRYWPAAAPAAAATATGATIGHRFVTGSLPLPHVDGWLLTGRVSPAQAPWLSDHALADVPLVPGAALAELVWIAARQAGAARVDELVLTEPILLPSDGGALDVQVFVERAGADGLRAVSVHARPAGPPVAAASGQAAWVLHAHGRIGGGEPSVALEPQACATGEWPPRDALETDLSSAYERLAADGYTYGPAFRALRRLWRRGDELFAEVALPEQTRTDDGFGVHPVLIDAALHAVLLASPQGSATRMPFSWSGVRIRPSGSRVLRIRAVPSGEGSWALSATDTTGATVFEVGAVSLLPASGIHPPLLENAWTATALYAVPATGADTVVLGLPLPGLPGVPAVAGLADVHTVSRTRAPRTIVVGPEQSAGPSVSAEGHGREVPVALHAAAHRHVRLLQDFLAEERFAGTTLVLCTLRATTPDPDPVAAAVSALWRSAAAEHPGRLVHVDLDGTAASDALVIAAVAAGEPRLALRGGLAHTPALAQVRDDTLVPPRGPGSWKLALTGPARLTTPERLALVPAPEHDTAPAAGQVRVRVRAAGLNFVDVITTMGLFPGDASLGREFAGVVTETGPQVVGLAPGDRVMGILGLSGSAIAPHVIADHRLVTRVPDTWTFAEAATVPIAFLTAHHGLVTLGGLTAGESVLLHAATGGVGMAALQIARHLGAEVFATAHPDKWPTLAALGVAPGRIASSRSAEFEHVFRTATAGRGVDVVLDALAGPQVDASLRLLAPEGRFLEMGKLDIRTRQQVDAIRPGARYRPFDILSVEADGIADAYRALMPLFDKGVLRPLPLTAWDVRDAKDALLTFRDARHTGKLVLTVPARPEPDGTVLITGGAGSLGAELARHLVRRHGTRHLLLAGRAPADDPRVLTLADELTALGADVGYRQTDVSDAGQVAKLLASVPAEHPLTAVVHAAGALRDATVTSLDDERIDAVLAPKADGAWHLHEQTRDLDLAWFTLYSSVAGVLGLAGQANYAAANAFLDALAAHRAARGLPGRSIAWGLWEQPTGMSSHLTALDIGRMASAGLAPLPTHQGLALFDAATRRPEAGLVATRRATPGTARPDVGGAGDVPDVGPGSGSAPGGAPTLRDRLSQLPADRRADGAVDWIRRQAATVLRLADQDAIGLSRSFRDLGFDSLTSVELRNELSAATGLRLPVTVVFEHPTPEALAELVVERLFPSPSEPLGTAPGPASDGAAEVPDAPALPLDVAKAGAQELLRLIDAELDGTGTETGVDTGSGEAGR